MDEAASDSYGWSIWELTIVLIFWLAFSIPGFIVARRRHVPYSGIAFVPLFGPMIVLLRAARISAWWTLLMVLLPFAALFLAIWLSIETPKQHGRNRWWTLPLAVPLVNVVAWWVYALTLAEAAEPWNEQVQASGRQVAPEPAVQGAATLDEKNELIRRLVELRDAGVLSDEEFTAKVAEVVRRT